MRRNNKAMEDFLKGTFTSGGIFEEPAKVKFKTPPKVKFKTPPKKGPGHDVNLDNFIHKSRPKKSTEPTIDAKKAAKIKKLEALANDPAATAAEKEVARTKIAKLRG